MCVDQHTKEHVDAVTNTVLLAYLSNLQPIIDVLLPAACTQV
jgi:hypothetical protein